METRLLCVHTSIQFWLHKILTQGDLGFADKKTANYTGCVEKMFTITNFYALKLHLSLIMTITVINQSFHNKYNAKWL